MCHYMLLSYDKCIKNIKITHNSKTISMKELEKLFFLKNHTSFFILSYFKERYKWNICILTTLYKCKEIILQEHSY